MSDLGNRVQSSSIDRIQPKGRTRPCRPRTVGTIYLPAMLVLVFLLTSCIFAETPDENGQTEEETAMSAAVAATVEVAVAATVDSMAAGSDVSTAVESNGQAAGGDGASVEPAVPELTEQEQQVAQWVTENTRHYIGDPNAPVVFIEFSDFQ